MPRYVHTSRRKTDRSLMVFELETSNLPFTEFELLKTYMLNQETGELTEYVKPERLFAVLYSDNSISKPHVQKFWNFNGEGYYEVMPNGDYRKLTSEEVQQLKEENDAE